MSRRSGVRRAGPTVVAAVLTAGLLLACEADPVAPGAGTAPGAEVPPSVPPTSDAPPAEPEVPAEEETARHDDPTTVDVSEVHWTAWELERRRRAAPEPPPEYYQDSEEGAVAAAFHLLDVFVHMYNTLVTDTWAELSGPDCGYCDDTIEDVTRWSVMGTYDEDYVIEVVEYQTDPDAPVGDWTVSMDVTELERQIVDSVGDPYELLEEDQFFFLLGLTWTGDGWILEGATQMYY